MNRAALSFLTLTACLLFSMVPAAVYGSNPTGSEDLIRKIEQNSFLRFAPGSSTDWQSRELEAILQALNMLPRELKSGKAVQLNKNPEIFSFSENDKALVTFRQNKRLITIRELAPAGKNISTIENDFYIHLKRELIFFLSVLYYLEMPADMQNEWKAFAGWEEILPGIFKAENRCAAGFADDSGQISPEYDFGSYALEYFMPAPCLDAQNDICCRLPGRYDFFSRLFPDYSRQHECMSCGESCRKWIDPDDVEHVEIIVTTPSSSSPASVAGHTLFLIKRKQDYYDGSDSLVFGFVGTTARDKANGIGGLRYAWRGISGYYDSAVLEEPFESLVLRATVLENRDVIRYKLKLDTEQIKKLVERLWVIRNTFIYSYRFFDVNCATMLLDALNFALPQQDKIEISSFPVPPMYVVSEIMDKGLIDVFVYPAFRSIGKSARFAYRKSRQIKKRILSLLKSKTSSGLPESVYQRAVSLFKAAEDKGTSILKTDSLFRTPVLETDMNTRAAAYRETGTLFRELYISYTFNTAHSINPANPDNSSTPVFSPDEYRILARLLVRFYLYADIYERYTAVPQEIREQNSGSDPLPAQVKKEIIARQLRQVQLRQRNSKSLASLRSSLSEFREFIKKQYSDPALYLAGKEIQAEMLADIKTSLNKASRKDGYFPLFPGFSWKRQEDIHYASFSTASAVYCDDIGSKSLFALKQDMKLVLLYGEIDFEVPLGPAGAPSPADGSRISTRSLLLDIEKIFVPETIDYPGMFNLGLGLRLLDTRSFLWDGSRLYPDDSRETQVLEFKTILNVAEHDNFTSYFNLKSGAGYYLKHEAGKYRHYLNLPLEAELKIHPGGKMDNAVRLTVRYDPFLQFTPVWFSRFRAEASVSFASFRTGFSCEVEHIHENNTVSESGILYSAWMKIKL